jgi:hypothetical protein
MNLLTLLLILSAVAMYLVARYERHAKSVEAVSTITSIAKLAAAYYDASDANPPPGFNAETSHVLRHFPPASRTSVPPDLRDIRGARYQSSAADWSYSPWVDLKFTIPQPQYYAYAFASGGVGPTAHASAIAQGDLDGDGTLSLSTLSVAPDASLHAVVAPVVERSNPEE